MSTSHIRSTGLAQGYRNIVSNKASLIQRNSNAYLLKNTSRAFTSTSQKSGQQQNQNLSNQQQRSNISNSASKSSNQQQIDSGGSRDTLTLRTVDLTTPSTASKTTAPPPPTLRLVGYDEVNNYAQTTGQVNQDALSQYVLAQGGTPGEARGLFNAIDLDKSGVLSETEFNQVGDLLANYDRFEFDAAAGAIDDESGVNLEVFSRFAQDLGLTESEAQSAFSSIDRNESGGLREAEFDSWSGMFRKWLVAESSDGTTQPTEPPAVTLPDQSIPAPTEGQPDDPIAVDPIALDLLQPQQPPSSDSDSGMPNDLYLGDDYSDNASPKFENIKNLVENYETLPLEFRTDIAPSIQAYLDFLVQNGTVDFITDEYDPNFEEFLYGWVSDLQSSDPELSSLIETWLIKNGVFNPAEPPPTPHYELENPPVTIQYDTPEDAVEANITETIEGQSVYLFVVNELLTDLPVDPNDSDAGFLTIGQAAIQDIYAEYNAGLDGGEIEESDPRAQLVRAMDAQSTLANGFDLIAYYEEPGVINGNTKRRYPSNHNEKADRNNSGQITYRMSPADMAEIIDSSALQDQLSELWNDPTILNDYAEKVQLLANDLPNKEGISGQLQSVIESAEYQYAIADLMASGFTAEAEQMISRHLANLAMLDPEAAGEATQNLALGMIPQAFNTVLADPTLVDSDTSLLALQDVTTLTLDALSKGFGVVRHSAETQTKCITYLEESIRNQRNVTALNDVLRQLVLDAQNGKVFDLGNINKDQFIYAMERTYVPADLREGLMGFMAQAQKIGVWGTITGAASIASFAYKVGKLNPDSSPMERWDAARDMLAFISVFGHAPKLAATAWDNWKSLSSGTLSTAAWQALGLDRTLPKLFGKDQFIKIDWNSFLGNSIQDSSSDGSHQSVNTQDSLQTDQADARFPTTTVIDIDAPSVSYLDEIVNADTTEKYIENVADVFKEKSPDIPAGVATKIAGTIIHLAKTADLLGIADVVSGGINAHRAREQGDEVRFATSTVEAIGGAFTTAGGIIGTTGLFVNLPALVTAAASPLLLVGAALGLIAIFVSIGVSRHRRNQEFKQNTETQSDWFKSLAADGLTFPDWGDKLEFLRYAWSEYGNDNIDENESYFEAQREEWLYFRNTAQERGSSLNRLHRGLHIETDLTLAGASKYEAGDWGS